VLVYGSDSDVADGMGSSTAGEWTGADHGSFPFRSLAHAPERQRKPVASGRRPTLRAVLSTYRARF